MMNYKVNDFFMTRVPLLPISSYLTLFADTEDVDIAIIKNFNHPILLESLSLSSKDLL